MYLFHLSKYSFNDPTEKARLENISYCSVMAMSATKKNKKSSSVNNIVKALEQELRSGSGLAATMDGRGGKPMGKSKMAGKGQPMFGLNGMDLILIGAKRAPGNVGEEEQQAGQKR